MKRTTTPTMDERIDMLALYEASQGHTRIASPRQRWEAFREFKMMIRRGDLDNIPGTKGPIAALDAMVHARWGPESRLVVDPLAEVLAAAGISGETVDSKK